MSCRKVGAYQEERAFPFLSKHNLPWLSWHRLASPPILSHLGASRGVAGAQRSSFQESWQNSISKRVFS